MTTTISGSNGIVFPDATSMQTGQQACKAWVNFNGEGTVAIRAGYNVSSITDVATGNFIVNFTTALADINAAVTAINGDTTPHTQRLIITTAGMVDTSSCYVSLFTSASANASIVSVAVFN
tara:strand:- start:41 stop:403 length:363 start_codon:yes stop_codon:yes gene_type:complete